jgi:hypothetical protein
MAWSSSLRAKACGGAVFDPQGDRILYPAQPDGHASRKSFKTPIRLLTLEWFFPGGRPIDGVEFLSAARDLCPDAVPTRFGDFKPLHFKMSEPGGEERSRDGVDGGLQFPRDSFRQSQVIEPQYSLSGPTLSWRTGSLGKLRGMDVTESPGAGGPDERARIRCGAD